MAEANSFLVNPIATSAQLETSSSQLDGVPNDLVDSVRFAGCRMLQAAGVLLRLPQDAIAQGIVIFTRFWLGPEGGSLKEYGVQDVVSACLSLVTKLSPHPRSPRRILIVVAYLASRPSTFYQINQDNALQDPTSYFLSESTYQNLRSRMHNHELVILRTIGFCVHVAVPHTLCINYLQVLDVFKHANGKLVAKRAFAHLNGALLSRQIPYLTHQPYELAVAAVYLAAREVGVKLPEVEWWEIFDVEREELGFLVVAMQSLEGWVEKQKRQWEGKLIPLDVEGVSAECERIAQNSIGAGNDMT